MSGLNAFVFALVLVLWMKASSSSALTSVTLQTSEIITSSPAVSLSVTSQVSENVTSSPVASTTINLPASENIISSPVVSTSVTLQVTENVASSSVHATSASVALQVSESVTSSPVASATVNLLASENITSSPVASTSVTSQVSENVTSSFASATVNLLASENITSSPVASPSVTLQASENGTSSSVHVTSASVTAVQASKNVTSGASTFAAQASINVTTIVSGSASVHPTPGNSSSVHFYETSQPSTQVSPIVSSYTSSPNTTKSLPSAAVSATSFTSQSVSKFSAAVAVQTSKMSTLPSSVAPSPSVSKSTQDGASTLTQSKETVSVMTHLVGSLTVSTSNSSSTSSRTINTTSATSPATPTTAQPTAATLPSGGTKFVSMEVSFDIEFKEEYSDTGSPEYEELENNLTTSLVKVFKNVDGFVGVRILLITKGSVVCSYIVILAKDSKVKGSELKEKLQQASDAGELFRVTSIKVEEDDSEEAEEKLPKWALVVMIVLGCLSAVFLVTVIYVCVKYRRSLYGSSEAYLVSSGEIGLAHTYDSVSIGDNKNGANQGTTQKPAAGRRVIGSHTNPTYGSNGALAD